MNKIILNAAIYSGLLFSSSFGQDISLKSGWNLVGSNQNNININTSISTAKTVWKYNDNNWKATSPNGDYTNAISSSGIDTFSTVNAGDGFWINIDQDTNVTLSGDTPSDTTLNLKSGWNLVSLKGSLDVNVSEYLTDNLIQTVWKYSNGSWQAYSPHETTANSITSSGITTLTTLNVGDGFWINTETDLNISSNTNESENTGDSTITFGGLTYKTITSSITNRIWLDRNLGASQSCTSISDESCYGDYYEWGRGADGHEKSTSETTTSKKSSIDTADSDFVIFKEDWTSDDTSGSLREAKWSQINGSSICPYGYRVPTVEEIEAEKVNDTDVFDNLNLPYAGIRGYSGNGTMDYQGTKGYLWTSNAGSSYKAGLLTHTYSYISYGYRSVGIPVRCIKHETKITSSSTVNVYENQTNVLTVTTNDTNVTFSISGTDADSFDINNSTGIITFKEAPVYETKNSYVFTVDVTNSISDITSQDITVNIESMSGVVMHNGIGYKTVTSPYTGKIWLDRNLGASKVCTSITDEDCYGDYYQWGRNTDGHEKSNSQTTTTQATDINNTNNMFIIKFQGGFYQGNFFPSTNDWLAGNTNGELRNTNWSKTDGSSICPIGYRVPSIEELEAETTNISTPSTNNIDAFNSFLKIPSSGERTLDSTMLYVGKIAKLYSSTFYSDLFAKTGKTMYFGSSSANSSQEIVFAGLPVRCIKD